MTARF